MALALFLAAASRPGGEETAGIEIRAFLPPGIVLRTPPSQSAPGAIVDRAAKGVVEPVDVVDRKVRESIKDLFTGMGKEGVVRPEGTTQSDGGDSGPPPAENRVVVDSDEPTDQYDEYPVVTSAPEPEYPPIARDAGIEGKVIVEALVGRDGRVRKVVVKEGNTMLAESAAWAVKSWRFKPARWRGEAVTAWVAVPVLFRLH